MKKEPMQMWEMVQEIYDDGFREGLEEARREGLEEGRQQEKRDIACCLLREGLVADLVAKYTLLSVDEVNALQRQLAE
ncbi:hypothetical protein [Alicyclobacillus fodiniaquatilis]|uniref:Transposase/invertase (TIGR01784 family) n=1 Tax=Alicyclobacillus fodiniaquatilis TaxID=1661150 RepID=A0ABW4JE21_9BACL